MRKSQGEVCDVVALKVVEQPSENEDGGLLVIIRIGRAGGEQADVRGVVV